MAHQATITAQTGPARQNTALVLQNVTAVNFDLLQPSIQIQTVVGAGDNIKEFDLTGVTTVTCTIAAGQYSFVLS
jgi:hypothetical protein